MPDHLTSEPIIRNPRTAEQLFNRDNCIPDVLSALEASDPRVVLVPSCMPG